MNTQLLESQSTIEYSIREEVATEMAQRSQQLLEQISSLQSQVSDTSESYSYDLTKSVRKAQHKQQEIIAERTQEEFEECIRELELELDTVRSTYEERISGLVSEKAALEQALKSHQEEAKQYQATIEALQRKSDGTPVLDTSNKTEPTVFSVVEAAAAKEETLMDAANSLGGVDVVIPALRLSRSSQSSVRISGSVAKDARDSSATQELGVQTGEIQRISAADELNKRLKRDQRFKKSEEGLSKQPKQSPVRSPLTPAMNANSIVDVTKGDSTGKKRDVDKAELSPKRQSARKKTSTDVENVPLVRDTAKTRARDAAIKSPKRATGSGSTEINASEIFQARRLRSRMRA
jgi:hypothetical protein